MPYERKREMNHKDLTKPKITRLTVTWDFKELKTIDQIDAAIREVADFMAAHLCEKALKDHDTEGKLLQECSHPHPASFTRKMDQRRK